MKRVIFFSLIGIIVALVIFFGLGLNKSLFSNGREDLPEQYKHNRFYSDGSVKIDVYVNDEKMDVKVFPDENAPDIAGYDNFGDYVLAQPIADFLGITCVADAEKNTLTLSSGKYEDTVYPYENYVKIIDDEMYIDFALFRVHTFGSLKQEDAKAMYLYTWDYQRSDIPATLEECYAALDEELTRKDKKYYKNISDEESH